MGRFVLVIRVAFDTLFLARSVLRAPTHHCSTVEMVMRTQNGRTTRLLLTHSCRAPCATKGGGGGVGSRTREMASSWAETLLEKKEIKRIASSVDGLFILKIRCVYLFTFCEMRPGCVLKQGRDGGATYCDRPLCRGWAGNLQLAKMQTDRRGSTIPCSCPRMVRMKSSVKNECPGDRSNRGCGFGVYQGWDLLKTGQCAGVLLDAPRIFWQLSTVHFTGSAWAT